MMRRRSGGIGGEGLWMLFLFIAAATVPASLIWQRYSFSSSARGTFYIVVAVFAACAGAIGTTALFQKVSGADGFWILYFVALGLAAIWGLLISAVAFPKLGERHDADHPTNGETTMPNHQRAATMPNQNEAYPWETTTEPKSQKRVILGVGTVTIAILVVAAIVWAVASGDEPTVYAVCDDYLRQLLVNSPGATASTENANTAVAHVQSQRPKTCPQGGWNPLVTDIASPSDGSITVTFATATGNARAAAVTLPEVDGTGWLYDANTQTWGTLPPTIGSSVIQKSPTECDALLTQALHASTAANAASGNSAIETVRKDGPAICSSNQWLPKIKTMERDYIGNIEVLFFPNSDGVTRPADGSLRWTYTVVDGNWRPADFSVPSVLSTYQLEKRQH